MTSTTVKTTHGKIKFVRTGDTTHVTAQTLNTEFAVHPSRVSNSRSFVAAGRVGRQNNVVFISSTEKKAYAAFIAHAMYVELNSHRF